MTDVIYPKNKVLYIKHVFFTLMILWLANITNIINHNVIQVLFEINR